MSEIHITCPKCGSLTQSGKFKPEKTSYNEQLDVWNCFLCRSSGKGNPMEPAKVVFSPVFEELVEVFHQCLLSEIDVLKWVLGRMGITYNDPKNDMRTQMALESIKKYKLGYDSERDAIAIPSWVSGELRGIKYRLLNNEDMRYISEPGSENGFYVLNEQEKPNKIIFVEGEFDAIAVDLLGFDGMMVSLQTNNAKKSLRSRLKELLKDVKTVYVLPDNDVAGQELVNSVLDLTTESKLVVLKLQDSYKDISEMLQDLTIVPAQQSWVQMLNNSRSKVAKETYKFFDNIEQTVEFLSNRKNVVGDSSGIKLLDEKLGGGFRPHEMTIIHAAAKVGKTTFANQLMFNLLMAGHKVGFASLEMDPMSQIKPSFISMALGKNIRRMEGKELVNSISHAITSCPELNNLVFFDRYGVTSASDICDWIDYVHCDLGVNYIFFDHVGYSLEDQSSAKDNSNLAKLLKGMTRKHPIHLFPIVQPPKLQLNYKGEMPTLGKETLYGGASWGQALDNLITLQRAPNQEDTLEVRLIESRFPMAKSGSSAVILFYDRETCSLIG